MLLPSLPHDAPMVHYTITCAITGLVLQTGTAPESEVWCWQANTVEADQVVIEITKRILH